MRLQYLFGPDAECDYLHLLHEAKASSINIVVVTYNCSKLRISVLFHVPVTLLKYLLMEKRVKSDIIDKEENVIRQSVECPNITVCGLRCTEDKNFFPSHAFFAPSAQKGIDTGKKSTRLK